jgi:CheY-like chemotaxis protein
VEDEGCGMNAETRSHIFEPFFTTKAADRGTGLGLSTAHGIVRQSGGEITVESEPGVGATFRISLPRTDQAPAPGRHPEGAPATASGRGSILLIEDDPTILALAREVLMSHGHEVLTAVSGEDAMRLLETHDGSIDLLLTDLVLPGISGIETAGRIAPRLSGPRVLYTSGYNLQEIKRWAVVETPAAFLEKPFSPAALLHAVDRELARS